MCCPFHNDRTPSMRVDKNFICFGCGEKGNVIDFVSKLYKLKPYDAALKLIDDFGLTITVQRTKSHAPVDQRRIGRENERQLFEQKEDRMYSVYCSYYKLLKEWSVKFAPSSPDDQCHPLFLEAVQNICYVEYILDVLCGRDKEKKKAVIEEKWKESEDIEKHIRKHRT